MKKILFALVALLGFASCEQVSVDPIIEETLTLIADKSEITADGNDVATFTVKSADNEAVDATIYFAETNEAIEGNTFKTKYAGEYKFYAKRNNEISNTITITAKAKSNGDDNGEEPAQKELVLS
ncbi:MAG: membrane lipoprotein lipid attachment site-containing protein, partial [Alistipes sp.]|nr:membrane lipoprotein lipid attachment site-containing protein [Alistipes sp.]